MKTFLVLGLGRFGFSFAVTLTEMGYQVFGVDRDKNIVQAAADSIAHVAQADCSDENFLASIDIPSFDAVMLSIGDNMETSIIAAVLLKELKARYILAKANNELHGRILNKLGADRIIFPERDMGVKIANSLVSSNFIDMIELTPDYGIFEITPPPSWHGATIGSLAVRSKYGVNVLAVKSGTSVNVAPDANTVIDPVSIMVLVGSANSMKKIRSIK